MYDPTGNRKMIKLIPAPIFIRSIPKIMTLICYQTMCSYTEYLLYVRRGYTCTIKVRESGMVMIAVAGIQRDKGRNVRYLVNTIIRIQYNVMTYMVGRHLSY